MSRLASTYLTILLLLPLLLGSFSPVCAQHLQNPISVAYLQENLRKGLPRLVLNAENEANLKERLQTDPVVQNIYRGIQERAESILEEPIVNLDTPMEERSQDNQLDISRRLLQRINMLAIVYRIEREPRMLERINQEVIAACNFPTWFPEHFLDVGEMSLGIATDVCRTAQVRPAAVC